MTKILVVDDSKTDRMLVGGLLEGCGLYDIVYASDGCDAIKQLCTHRPDLVITDLQMPEMNGLELVDAIKEDAPSIPVILVTAQGSEEIAAKALQHGAASYVPKRNLSADLEMTVARVLDAALEDNSQPHIMHHLLCSDSQFVLYNDPALIDSLLIHIQESLRCLPLGDETERLRTGIAVEEALMNAYYHGNLEVGAIVDKPNRENYIRAAEERRMQSPYAERAIHIRVQVSRKEARFTIRDDGPGFDFANLPCPGEVAVLEHSVGRGIVLMRTFMDEVTYNDRGNEVTLVKRCFAEP